MREMVMRLTQGTQYGNENGSAPFAGGTQGMIKTNKLTAMEKYNAISHDTNAERGYPACFLRLRMKKTPTTSARSKSRLG